MSSHSEGDPYPDVLGIVTGSNSKVSRAEIHLSIAAHQNKCINHQRLVWKQTLAMLPSPPPCGVFWGRWAGGVGLPSSVIVPLLRARPPAVSSSEGNPTAFKNTPVSPLWKLKRVPRPHLGKGICWRVFSMSSHQRHESLPRHHPGPRGHLGTPLASLPNCSGLVQNRVPVPSPCASVRRIHPGPVLLPLRRNRIIVKF